MSERPGRFHALHEYRYGTVWLMAADVTLLGARPDGLGRWNKVVRTDLPAEQSARGIVPDYHDIIERKPAGRILGETARKYRTPIEHAGVEYPFLDCVKSTQRRMPARLSQFSRPAP